MGNDPVNSVDPTGKNTDALEGTMRDQNKKYPTIACVRGGGCRILGETIVTNDEKVSFNNRRTNRGGQGQGERNLAGSADGTPDPDKHRRPGEKLGTRVWKDQNGKTVTGKWDQDPRIGGDGSGVRRGSKIPAVPKPKLPKTKFRGRLGIIVPLAGVGLYALYSAQCNLGAQAACKARASEFPNGVPSIF